MNKKISITIAMALGIFLVMLDTTIMNIALPAIQRGIEVDYNQLSWALNIYTIIFATCTIPLSKFGDIFGKNKTYIVGLVLFGLGSLSSGFATTFVYLIIGRIFSSLGASILLPLGNAIGLSTWNIKNRFKIVAILGLTQGGAAAIGPTLGGVITDFFGWHWIFLMNIPIVLIGIFLSGISLNFNNDIKLKEKIDWVGSLISMLSLFFLTLGLIKLKDWGIQNFKTVMCFLLSIVLISLFIFVERTVRHPMINLSLFKVKDFSASAIVALLAQFFYIGVVVVIPSFLTNVDHKTELEAALILLPMSLTVFAFGGLGSLVINKLGPRLLVLVGMISILLAYILIVMNGAASSSWLSVALLILGIGFGIIAGPINVLAASNFSGSLLTSSQSVISVVRQIGSVLGVSVFLSMMSSNIKALRIIDLTKLNHAYLSIYNMWIPVLIVLLPIMFSFPTKKKYLVKK
ncbi:MFS transporter [Companilactobacillus musae]|uniref:MFS transporter n=1 Tax=Companilactobacillus musae TaxID=1903258 RepID=UPI000E656D53|nr:MFS transporter [Companilactobacillus musae]